METLIQYEDLKEGDILLYHGESWISRAIRFFDGTDYNHASLYAGNHNVTEAIAQGVVKRDIGESINKSNHVIVMRLNSRPSDIYPVIQKSSEYENNRYAYEQIILLALICSFRKIRLNNIVAKLVGKILEAAAAVLLRLTGGNKEALICSELVFRCYNEAIDGYDDPYTIYLVRDFPVMQSIYLKHDKPAGYFSVSEESLVSYFYGINRTYSIRKSPVSPFLEKENIEHIDDFITSYSREQDEELEQLVDDAIESYIKEDYQLDKAEEIRLKRSLDIFIAANSYSKGSDRAFILPGGASNTLNQFLKSNENFVTPGDLFKAKNLQGIGRIK